MLLSWENYQDYQQSKRDVEMMRKRVNDLDSMRCHLQEEKDLLIAENKSISEQLQSSLQDFARLQEEYSKLSTKFVDCESENRLLRAQFLKAHELYKSVPETWQQEKTKLQYDLEKSETERKKLDKMNWELKKWLRVEREKSSLAVQQKNYYEKQWENRSNETNIVTSEYRDTIKNVSKVASRMVKEGDALPLHDTNNEDVVQRFVNKVILEAQRWLEKAHDVSPTTLQRTAVERQNCRYCRKPFRLAKCFQRSCGSTFHEECIRECFRKKIGCPECKNDSIQFLGDR